MTDVVDEGTSKDARRRELIDRRDTCAAASLAYSVRSCSRVGVRWARCTVLECVNGSVYQSLVGSAKGLIGGELVVFATTTLPRKLRSDFVGILG